MSEYLLRMATVEDEPFLFSLIETTLRKYVEELWNWDPVFQRQGFRDRFDPDTTEIIQVEGRDVGCVIVEDRLFEHYIAELLILPDYQNRGIGTSILRNLMAEAQAEDVPLKLQVLKNNPARRLYQRLGFRRVSRTTWHYQFEWP